MANVKKGIFNWHFLTKCNLNLPQPFWGVNLSLHPPPTAYPPCRSRSAGNRSLTSGVSSKCVIYIYKMKSTKQCRTMNLSRKDISGHKYFCFLHSCSCHKTFSHRNCMFPSPFFICVRRGLLSLGWVSALCVHTKPNREPECTLRTFNNQLPDLPAFLHIINGTFLSLFSPYLKIVCLIQKEKQCSWNRTFNTREILCSTLYSVRSAI